MVLVHGVTLSSLAGYVQAFSVDRVLDLPPVGRPWGHPVLSALSPVESGHPARARSESVWALAQYAPSLYDALQQAPVPGAPNQRWVGGHDPARSPPVGAGEPTAKQYRFRGDKPPAEGDPEKPGDHRFRPLTAKERQRQQPASVWRPLTEAPQGISPAPLPGYGQPPGGGGPWGVPGYANPSDPAENTVPSDLDGENWFDRYYGRERR